MNRPIIKTLQLNMKRALATGQLKEAESILARLQKEDPLSAATRGFELEFLLNSDRLCEAEALAEQLCRLFPESARILFLAGKLAYHLKRYPEAEALFRESLKLYHSRQTQHWLGKALTQSGKFDEAESLLHLALEQYRHALLDLAWLYERKNDLEAALKAVNQFLSENPDNTYAAQQRTRIRAKIIEPEELVSEMSALASLGEEVPASLFPQYIQRLFETGQSPTAREEISARMQELDSNNAVRVAWICYQAQAYDLACTLFLMHLAGNTANIKYLTALESAAAKCNRLAEVVTAYKSFLPQTARFYGRLRSLARRQKC